MGKNVKNSRRARFKFPLLLLLINMVLPMPHANASEVQQVTLAQAAQKSQLIFEGQVVSKRESLAANGDPYTYFTFKILSVIKGGYALPTIELGYMGGTTADGFVMKISDMRMPKVGEHGIYFVESLTRQQVHPLYGWQQGHYLVIPASVGTPARVIPVNTPAGAATAAPSLAQFKQQVRSLAGGVK